MKPALTSLISSKPKKKEDRSPGNHRAAMHLHRQALFIHKSNRKPLSGALEVRMMASIATVIPGHIGSEAVVPLPNERRSEAQYSGKHERKDYV